ncbi:uncharacterized protein LOC124169114 [Ischnura elegans]|uniref:uncharacterized protein LOC124169114 n=1 Tax=Ischnura elegans TaxID=197161 RepID=UPI001ED8BD7C|nr:uncharacterized protein LOC124169114 [Ischnura elegans]
MHFWIDKRSQACGGAAPGRLRGPPIPPHRRHQAHGLFRSGRSAIPRRSIAKPPPHRPRSRLNAPPGGRGAMPPLHHHEAVVPPSQHPPNITLSRPSESFASSVHPLGHASIDADLVAARNADCTHAPSSRPPPPHVFGEDSVGDGSQNGGGAIPPGSVRKLHCGMWAGFAMAVFFVGGTKVYFDRQGSGVEMLVFCAMLLLFLLAGCIVSICRSRGDRQLAQQYLEAFQHQNNRPTDALHSTEPPQRVTRADAGPTGEQPSANAVTLPTECALPRADGGPPPPYHIAILLPQPPRSLPPTPPPSYAKATT